MNISQAKQKLTKLGFVFSSPDSPKWGRRNLTESFDFKPNHLLTVPYRDVYIGKATDGWYITSSIHFRGRIFRHHSFNTNWMSRRNICAIGSTLLEAVVQFNTQFWLNELANAPKSKA